MADAEEGLQPACTRARATAACEMIAVSSGVLRGQPSQRSSSAEGLQSAPVVSCQSRPPRPSLPAAQHPAHIHLDPDRCLGSGRWGSTPHGTSLRARRLRAPLDVQGAQAASSNHTPSLPRHPHAYQLPHVSRACPGHRLTSSWTPRARPTLLGRRPFARRSASGTGPGLARVLPRASTDDSFLASGAFPTAATDPAGLVRLVRRAASEYGRLPAELHECERRAGRVLRGEQTPPAFWEAAHDASDGSQISSHRGFTPLSKKCRSGGSIHLRLVSRFSA